ncbi:MAG: hypothetical protein LUF27_03940 [Lachnospiraceae bacterium]|nr:hypothetical protein [Lachnospiraceae bacterium]
MAKITKIEQTTPAIAARKKVAAAGIRPIAGFSCLNDADYKALNTMADYMAEVSGAGAFKGEYVKEATQNA